VGRVARYGVCLAVSAAVHWAVIAPPGGVPAAKPVDRAAIVEIAKVAKEIEAVKDALAEKAKALEEKLAPDPAKPDPAQAEAAAPKPAPALPQADKNEPGASTPPAPPPPAKSKSPGEEELKPDADPRFADAVVPPETPKSDAKEDRRVKELEEKLAQAEAEKAKLAHERAKAEAQAQQAAERAARENQALAEAAQRDRAEKEALAKRAERSEADRIAAVRKAEGEKADFVRRSEEQARRAEAEKAELARRAAEAQAAAAARASSAERAAADARRQAQEATARAEREERALAERIATLDDAQKAEQANVDVTRVPAIVFRTNESEAAYIDFLRFFGMKVAVFPPSKRFLAAVDLVSGEVEPVQDGTAFMAQFNKRVIYEKGDYFDRVADRVAQRMGARGENLVVMTLMPHRTARYLGWKELEVCRRAGVDPTSVQQAIATYERGQGGRWIVRIVELQKWNGDKVPVRDFEGDRI